MATIFDREKHPTKLNLLNNQMCPDVLIAVSDAEISCSNIQDKYVAYYPSAEFTSYFR